MSEAEKVLSALSTLLLLSLCCCCCGCVWRSRKKGTDKLLFCVNGYELHGWDATKIKIKGEATVLLSMQTGTSSSSTKTRDKGGCRRTDGMDGWDGWDGWMDGALTTPCFSCSSLLSLSHTYRTRLVEQKKRAGLIMYCNASMCYFPGERVRSTQK